jgi:outer membrane protein insertion porin family
MQFWRLQGEGRYYYPINEKITLVTRVLGGHVGLGRTGRALDQTSTTRGGETIRGFNRGGLGPRDLLTRDALGGDTFWAATAEVRYPIPFIPDELGMSGAAFVDAGSLFGAGALAKSLDGHCGEAATVNPVSGISSWNGVCLADSSAVRVSAGVSLIWNSPLGPLRLDVAKAIERGLRRRAAHRFGALTKF